MKKRVIALLLIFLIACSLLACKKNAQEETVSPSDGNVSAVSTEEPEGVKAVHLSTAEGYVSEWNEDTYETYAEMRYPVVLLTDGDETLYPNLEKAIAQLNKEKKDAQMDSFDECVQSAYEWMEEDTFNVSFPFVTEESVTVRRADSNVVSLLYYGYMYMGGAHGSYYYWGENFDTETGEKLSLSDVVIDMEKFPEVVESELLEFWDREYLYENVDFAEVLAEEEYISWTLDNHGVTIYFNPYEIAPYAAGVQIVTLTWEEYPELFKEKYQECRTSYGIEFNEWEPFYYDVTGDGQVDEIRFSGEIGEYGDIETITISVNDKTYVEDIYVFDIDMTFIHAQDGKNYLYAELLRENDYRETVCYRLDGNIQNIGYENGGMRTVYHENDEWWVSHDALTDPTHFYMEDITQFLCTAVGYQECRVGADGTPQKLGYAYRFDEESCVELTLLQDLELDVFDPFTQKVNGTKTFKKGEKILYTATDNEVYAYFEKDGETYRKELVREDYTLTIDGVPTTQAFDGLFFAG